MAVYIRPGTLLRKRLILLPLWFLVPESYRMTGRINVINILVFMFIENDLDFRRVPTPK